MRDIGEKTEELELRRGIGELELWEGSVDGMVAMIINFSTMPGIDDDVVGADQGTNILVGTDQTRTRTRG